MKRNNVFKFGMIINIIPFIMGGIYYNQLPETMATSFDFNNHANGFSSKPMALFGIPMILVLFTYSLIFLQVKILREVIKMKKL